MEDNKESSDVSTQQSFVRKPNKSNSAQSFPFIRKNTRVFLLCALIFSTILFGVLYAVSINNHSAKLVSIIFLVLLSVSTILAIIVFLSMLIKRLNNNWRSAAEKSADEYKHSLKCSFDLRNKAKQEDIRKLIETVMAKDEVADHVEVSFVAPIKFPNRMEYASRPSNIVSFVDSASSVNITGIEQALSSTENISDLDEMQNVLIGQIADVRRDSEISISQSKAIINVALGSFIFGFLLLAVSFLLPLILNQDMSAKLALSISAVLVDFISLVLFAVHSKVNKQLRSDRALLSGLLSQLNAICLIEKIHSSTERDKILVKIIQNSLKLSADFTRLVTQSTSDSEPNNK